MYVLNTTDDYDHSTNCTQIIENENDIFIIILNCSLLLKPKQCNINISHKFDNIH